MSALRRAIEICGTQAELARRIGGRVRTGHVYWWLRHHVPPDRAIEIERAVSGEVSRRDLCPDFPWDET